MRHSYRHAIWRHDSRKNKQLYDDTENDIVKYHHLGLSYQTKPKAEADIIDTKLIHNNMKKKTGIKQIFFSFWKQLQNKTFLSEGAKFCEHYTVEGLGN